MLHFEGMLGLRGLTEAKIWLRQIAPFGQAWQLGNVARYASSFIESQRLGDLCIVRIGMAVDISDLSVCCRLRS